MSDLDDLGLYMDLLISAGEISGDLHGAKLLDVLFRIKPDLQVGAVAGPQMRQFPIQEIFPMENLQTMGFLDVLPALPRLVNAFYLLRNYILKVQPKTVVCIDYPGFHLRLARSLRKKGFSGKLIHFICPTVWAWGKGRIPLMAQNLDQLFTLLPFEPACFAHTSLKTVYVGHPLARAIANFRPSGLFEGKILGIFPGSRKTEIKRNLPLQLLVAQRLQTLDPSLKLAISKTGLPLDVPGAMIVEPADSYELMRSCHLALATSGTVTLELALHHTPTVVSFAIRKMDQWIAQKIFRIDLPFYALPNIVASQEVFPELFGSNLTEEALFSHAKTFLQDRLARERCVSACKKVSALLGTQDAAFEAARAILLDFN